MKVIEYGHIEPIRARCRGCGALLEFIEREARSFRGELYVNCPMCGRAERFEMIYRDDEWQYQDAEEVELFNSNDLEYMF